jgi:tetratricopeptide (TPR) repeat protein
VTLAATCWRDPGFAVKPSAEPRLVPWHYTPDDQSRFLELISRTVPGVEHSLEVSSSRFLDECRAGALDVHASCVLIRCEGDGDDADPESLIRELRDMCKGSPPRFLLVYYPRPLLYGQGWVERELKVPLMETLKRHLHSPRHPLHRRRVSALPVNDLARLTGDPLELVDLADELLEYGLQLIHTSPDSTGTPSDGIAVEAQRTVDAAAAFQASMAFVVARHLARRLDRIKDRPRAYAWAYALQGDPEGLTEEEQDAASQALERVGLVRYVGRDISFGPLLRGIRELNGGLAALQPRAPSVLRSHIERSTDHSPARHSSEGWNPDLTASTAMSEATGPSLAPVKLRAEVLPEKGEPERADDDNGRGGESEERAKREHEWLAGPPRDPEGWHLRKILASLRPLLPDEPMVHDALEVVRRLEAYPSSGIELPREIRLAVGQARRRLGGKKRAVKRAEAELAGTLDALLRFFSSRGKEMVDERDQALEEMRRAWRLQEGEGWQEVLDRLELLALTSRFVRGREVDEWCGFGERMARLVSDEEQRPEDLAASFTLLKAHHQSRKGQPDEAEALVEEALKGFRRDGASLLEADAMLNQGYLLCGRGETKKAKETFDQVLNLTQPNELVYLDALLELADLEATQGDMERASVRLEREVIPSLVSAGRVLDYAVALGYFAHLKAQAGDVAGAQAMHEERLQVFERLGAVRSRAVTLGYLARLKAQAGDVAGAQAMHEEQIQVFEQLGDVRSRAVALGYLAHLKAQAGDVAGAQAMHEEQIQIFERLNDVRSRAMAQWDLSLVLSRQGRIQKAQDFQGQAYNAFKQVQDEQGLMIVGGTLGRTLLTLDRPDEARDVLNTALEAAKRLGDQAQISNIEDLLSRCPTDS